MTPSGQLNAEALKLYDDFKNVELFLNSTYKVKKTVGTEMKIMYPIESVVNIPAAQSLIEATFVKVLINGCIMHQDFRWLTNSRC